MSNTQFIDKKLFHKQIHAYCKISYKENSTEDIQVIVEYREDRPGKITGYLIGNAHAYYSLAQIISMDETYNNLHFKTTIREGENIYYESKYFSFKQIINSEAQIYTIGEIDFLELNIIGHFNQEIEERKIYFQITPPYYIWSSIYYSYEEASYNKAIPSREEESKLYLDDLIIRIIKSELIDSFENKNKITTKFVYYIECKSKKNDVSDDNFIKYSKNFIDDFLLVTSLISGHPIFWYRYKFLSNFKIEESIKSMDSEDKNGQGLRDLLIEGRDFKNFICSAMPRYLDLKKGNINLTVPIRSYLFSESAKFLEQRFILTYVALENICNQLSRVSNIECCINKKVFENLEEQLKNLIKSFNLDGIEENNMFKKLPELNRNPVKYKIEEIFNKYKIDINNCYDPNLNIKFLSIRNQLIHSSKHNIDSDSLLKEYYRIRKYFELLILKMLSWEKDISPYHFYNNIDFEK